MKYLMLIGLFVLSGCTSSYVISARNTRGDMDFAPIRNSFVKRTTLNKWSYFFGTIEGEIELPKDLNENQVDISQLHIQSYFSTTDTFLGIIPFAQRRTFHILGISRQDD